MLSGKHRSVEGYVDAVPVEVGGERYRPTWFPSVFRRDLQNINFSEATLEAAGFDPAVGAAIIHAEVVVDAASIEELQPRNIRLVGVLPNLGSNLLNDQRISS